MNKRIVFSGFLFLATLTTAGGALSAMTHLNHEALDTFGYSHEPFAAFHHEHEDLAAFGHDLIGIHNISRHQGYTAIACCDCPAIHTSMVHLGSEVVHLECVHCEVAAFSEEHASHHQDGHS